MYPVLRAVTVMVPEAAALSCNVASPCEFVIASAVMPPPDTLTVAPLTAEPLVVTEKVTYVATPFVILDGLALTASAGCPTAVSVVLAPEKPFLVAVAVIVPVPVELTWSMTCPFWFVMPFPLAAPVRVTVVSLTEPLPLVTVNMT